MPKQEQSFAVATEKEKTLGIVYETMESLGWEILYAGDDRLVGEVPGSGLSQKRQCVIVYSNGQVTISSETTNDALVDMGGKNKKNLAQFIAAYDEIKDNVSEDKLSAHQVSIRDLQRNTMEIIDRQERDAAEVDAAMNLSNSNLYVTYGIIAINVIVFILMAMQGAGVMEANGLVHIKWGSNYGPLTLTGDWWRLLTNVFIHFGIIHLAMNMYALYSISVYLEPMLGKVKFIAAYLCTGVLASLASLWWHTTPANSAGASGAVFGLYGLFLAMLTTDLIPASIRKGLLTNIAIFVAYNLFYGLKGGIDNAAHIGGLVSGLIIGYMYVLSLKKEKQGNPLKWILPVVVLATVGITVFYLDKNKGNASDRAKLDIELKSTSYKDSEIFYDNYNDIISLQDSALAPLREGTGYDQQLSNTLETKSLPLWNKAESIADKMTNRDVSPENKEKLNTIKKYIQQRKNEILLIQERINNASPENIAKIDSLTNEINQTVKVLQNQQ